MSGRKEKLVCGCVNDGHKWIHECDACKAEHAELHARAMADYRRSQQPPRESLSWIDD